MSTVIGVIKHGYGDPPVWSDLNEANLDEHLIAPTTEFVVIQGGMQSGKTSVAMRVERADGRKVIVEWSLAALNMAVHTALAFAEPWERDL